MKALLAIAEREIKDRWLLLAGAVFVGLVPWALVPFDPRRLGVIAGGLLASFLFVMITAALTGWSVIGRDLSEGRLAFFFARPAPWWAIWGGKWLAAVVLTLGSALITWLLVVPLEPTKIPEMGTWLMEGTVALAGAWCLLILAVSHVASVAFRSRSPLLALDLLLLAGSATLGVWLAIPLMLLGVLDGSGRSNWVFAGLVALVAAIPTLAGAVQIAEGRVDKRRGHRAMSLTLWSVVTVLLLGLGAWSYRVTHPQFEALERVGSASAAPAGSWIDVVGFTSRQGRVPVAFLVDTSSGRWVRRPFPAWNSAAVFSRDGLRAVWLGSSTFSLLHSRWDRLFVCRLDSPSLELTETPLGVPLEGDWMASLALSPDGSRLAVLGRDMLDIYDLTSGRQLAGIPGGGAAWRGPVVFWEGSRMRTYRERRPARPVTGRTLELVEVDTTTKTVASLGALDVPEGQVVLQALQGGRVLVSPPPRDWAPIRPTTENANVIEARELPSGQLLASIPVTEGRLLDGLLLEDGRIAILRSGDEATVQLDLHSPSGSRLWSSPVPAAGGSGTIDGQPDVTTLSVSTGRGFVVDLFQARSTVFDLATGTALRTREGMKSVPRLWWRSRSAQSALAARVVMSDNGGLFLLDPRSSEQRVLLEPRSKRR